MLRAPKNFVARIPDGVAVVKSVSSLVVEPYGDGVRLAMHEGETLHELFIGPGDAQHLANALNKAAQGFFMRAAENEDAANARQGNHRPGAGTATISSYGTIMDDDVMADFARKDLEFRRREQERVERARCTAPASSN